MRWLKEGDDLHLTAALRTGQRVDLVQPLDLPAGRQVSMAQVWLERLRAGAGPASPLDDAATGSTAAAAATAASAALRRIPRALLEYQP